MNNNLNNLLENIIKNSRSSYFNLEKLVYYNIIDVDILVEETIKKHNIDLNFYVARIIEKTKKPLPFHYKELIYLLSKECIKKKGIWEICSFAEMINNVQKDEFTNVIVERIDNNNITKQEYAYIESYIKLPEVDIDKIIDALIRIKNFKFLCNLIKNLNNIPVYKIFDAMIKEKDYEDIIKTAALISGAKKLKNKLADAIIESKNVEYIFRFARDVEDAPIDKLAVALIKTKEINYIVNIASKKGAPINKLADAVIESKNAEYIYSFARNIENAPVGKLADAIIKTKNLEYITYFALEVKNAPLNKLIDAIIKYGDAEEIYNFSIDASNYGINSFSIDNINILADAIIKSEDAGYICEFAIYIDNAPIDKLVDAIIKNGEIKYIYKLAEETQGEYLDKLTNAIIASNDSKYIYLCATIKNNKHNIDKLAIALMKAKNSEYIYKFIINVSDKYIDEMIDIIANSKEYEHIKKCAELVKERKDLTDKLIDGIIDIGNINYIEYFAIDNKWVPKKKLFNAYSKLGDDDSIREFALKVLYNNPIDKISIDNLYHLLENNKYNDIIEKNAAKFSSLFTDNEYDNRKEKIIIRKK